MSQMLESFLSDGGATAPLAQPLAFDEMAGGVPGATLLADAHPLHAVKVQLQVRVGAAEMTVGELLRARENDVLALDRAVDHPVDLLVEGRVVARGQLVAVDGSFGVRITELPLPLGF